MFVQSYAYNNSSKSDFEKHLHELKTSNNLLLHFMSLIDIFRYMTKYKNNPLNIPLGDSITMKDLVMIANALSDMNRVRTLCALREGELCVCRIVDLLNLAPSTVSKHMQILKHAGLVENRKEERWIYYRIVNECNCIAINKALDWVFGIAKNDAIIRNDRKLLLSICAQSPESLCKKRQARKTIKQRTISR